jgi:hypothetical protein
MHPSIVIEHINDRNTGADGSHTDLSSGRMTALSRKSELIVYMRTGKINNGCVRKKLKRARNTEAADAPLDGQNFRACRDIVIDQIPAAPHDRSCGRADRILPG